jgi:hypothetical protein
MARAKKLPAHLRTFRLTAREREQLAERDALIAALGWAPEDRTSAGSRYAATTGEMAVWVMETQPDHPVARKVRRVA